MKFSQLLVFSFTLLIIHTQNLFSQCSWVRGSSETMDYSADAWSIAIDDSDNYYVAGGFKQDFTAGGINFTTTTGQSLFIAKYSRYGNIQWGKVIETNDPNLVFLPRLDFFNDHLYVSGCAYGDITESGTSYGDASKFNFYLCRMTKEGSFDFIHTYRDSLSTSNLYVAGITHDASNNIYITGRFQGYLFWGGVTASSSTTTSFIAKFNSDGVFTSYEKTASPGSATSRGWPITTDTENNIYFGGLFANTLNYGSCNQVVSDITGFNPYIIKTDPSLGCLWMQIGDGAQTFSPVYGLTTDADNNVYACGNFNDTITWDGIELHASGGPFFLVKLNSGGDVIWARNYGTVTSEGQAAASLNFDLSGNIWMTGWQGGTSTYGSVTLNDQGVFAVLLDTAGNVLDGFMGEGLATSYASKIDHNGNLLIAGATEGDTIGIDDAEFYYTSDSSKGFFLAKYAMDLDTCNFVGIHEINISNENIFIYPNPSQGSFNIQIYADISSAAEIQIYDVTGSLIQTEKQYILSGINTIPIKITNESGYYMIKIIANNSQYISRILIE